MLNPAITEMFSGVSTAAKGALESTKSSGSGWIVLTAVSLVFIALFIWYYRASSLFEAPSNLASLSLAKAQLAKVYDSSFYGRKGLRAYLLDLKQAGVADTDLCVTNFYWSTVNGAGVFFPAVDAVISPIAISSAIRGGARAFVFDIWPDLTPGADFGPIVQVVESGSLWRRISLNSLPLVSLLKSLVQTMYEVQHPGSEDPVILYLRFRGKPRSRTFTATAGALRSTIEPYRLGSVYNNCRGQDTLYQTPMTSLFKKVIVMSNIRATGNALSDYINSGPKDGIKTEWAPNDANGLTVDGKASALSSIQKNLALVSPVNEDSKAADNSQATKPSFDIGVHMVGMNFWNTNDALKAYMAPTLFGKQSYSLKPAALRYSVQVLPNPQYPRDPGYGQGPTAGTPTTPTQLRV